MKYVNGTQRLIAKYHHGYTDINAIYHGLQLIWLKVSSCFGSGKWIDSRNWVDTEYWKDNI